MTLDYFNKVNDAYGIKLIDMPPLPDGEREIKNVVLERIDKTREILVEVAGLLPAGINYTAIAMVDGVAPAADVIFNCGIRTPPDCPPSSGVREVEIAAVNIMKDVSTTIIGDLGGKVLRGFDKTEELKLLADAKTSPFALIEEVNDYKTMPASEIWNLFKRHEPKLKSETIPQLINSTLSSIKDNLPKNDW